MRVSLEATGIYSLDLAMALDRADGVEVAVLNPKLVHRFAQTLRRSKTDSADAQTLAEYSRRMPFTPWRAPSLNSLQLRTISRHLLGLTAEYTRQNNRSPCRGEISGDAALRGERPEALHGFALGRILRFRREARQLVRSDETIQKRFELLIGIPGIAEISAVQLLGELSSLSPEMSVRQWVAHSGLDPVHQVSGTSVHKPSRMSRAGNRYLRRALYMPALVAVRLDPHLKAFYETLLSRHKAKLQALVAVARKLLHAIYGMLRSETSYDGNKLFPALMPAIIPR